MRVLAIRSIPLSKETADAWRESGVTFRRRNRPHVWDPRFHEPHFRAVLNLGSTSMNFEKVPVPVFNPPELIRRISSPAALRNTLADFLPAKSAEGAHWHKSPGHRGVGKTFHRETFVTCNTVFGDLQQHIEGDEYRIITVDGVVVQATKKEGTAPDFRYEWVGVNGISKGGFIPFLHEANDVIKDYGHSVIGWDVIHNGDRPYIIEANTSPGVNQFTAARIVAQMRESVKNAVH